MMTDESVSSVENKTTSTAESATVEVETGEAIPETTATTAETEQTDSMVTPEPSETIEEPVSTPSNVVESQTGPSIEELTRQLTESQKKAESHWDSLLRKQAEYDNLQKRSARELDNARKYALEKFATELLAIKDSMELGLEAAAKPETTLDTVREGMALTLKMLNDAMSKFNIIEIDPKEEKFNPQWHEAMAMQPTPEAEEGTVLYVHQKGYQLHDRLLRPARVIVAKAMEVAPTPTETQNSEAETVEKPIENQG